MNEDNLREIEERAEKATPGPWVTRVNFAVEDGEHDVVEVLDQVGVVILDMVRWQNWRDDAAFIAAARADVPAMVAEVRKLRSILGDVVEAFGADMATGYGPVAARRAEALGRAREAWLQVNG